MSRDNRIDRINRQNMEDRYLQRGASSAMLRGNGDNVIGQPAHSQHYPYLAIQQGEPVDNQNTHGAMIGAPISSNSQLRYNDAFAAYQSLLPYGSNVMRSAESNANPSLNLAGEDYADALDREMRPVPNINPNLPISGVRANNNINNPQRNILNINPNLPISGVRANNEPIRNISNEQVQMEEIRDKHAQDQNARHMRRYANGGHINSKLKGEFSKNTYLKDLLERSKAVAYSYR